MSVNVKMINAHYKIYGNNKNMQGKVKTKNLIKNISRFGNVKNVRMNQLSIVRKDAFSKIGLSNISLYVQGSHQKLEIH